MGYNVILFDYLMEIEKSDKQTMNRQLVSLVHNERPDLVFFSLYEDQFEPSAIEQINSVSKTFCFFHDDTWREEFSRFWAQYFHYFSSADFQCETRYKGFNASKVLHLPFGANQNLFKKIALEKLYDVSFIGAKTPFRSWIIKELKKSGYNVQAYGFGWENGEVSEEEMVKIFNQSQVNLNLSNSVSWDARYLLSSPRAIKNTLKSKKNVEQLKGRHFEICACGAFQLSYFVEGLEQCFQLNKEITVFLDVDDLKRKVDYFLKQPSKIASIAEAGHQRFLSDHTYEQRFRLAFQQMGLIA